MGKSARVWHLIGGTCDMPKGLDPDKAENQITLMTKEKRDLLEDQLANSQDIKDPFYRLYKVLSKYDSRSQSDPSLQTPLSLFVCHPRLFYEVFWPYGRNHVRRQYSILLFRSPIDIRSIHDFELELVKGRWSQPSQDNMIYLGCLTGRVPVLKAYIEGRRQTIIPFETLIERIVSFLIRQDDFRLLKEKLSLEDKVVNQLARKSLNESMPIFLEFNSTEHENKQMAIVSLKGESSLVLGESNEAEKGAIDIRRNSLLKRSARVLLSLPSRVFRVQFDEPNIVMTLFPKSPKATCWIYVFAPPKYEISVKRIMIDSKEFPFDKNKAIFEHKGNTLENNAMGNPRLVSFRLARRSDVETKCPELCLKVGVPKAHKSWLNGVNYVLEAFLLVWLLGGISLLPLVLPGDMFGAFSLFDPFYRVSSTSGFLETTFTLVSFVFIARSWFFHESSVYERCSKRFRRLLLTIAFLAVIQVVIKAFI